MCVTNARSRPPPRHLQRLSNSLLVRSRRRHETRIAPYHAAFMSNALYYTFSTIAQTLAGAMALLAAFLLYRLQVLNRAIDSDAERISSALKPYHGRADEMLRS